tara:strand:+ start:191 stop:580 length:390 start_codon:yes stop_codon:yes gene_type:complete
MKKLLYTLLAVSLIFSACKKEEEDDTTSSPFIGYWSGYYYQEDSTNVGAWNADISSSGEINGTAISSAAPQGVDLIGTVTNSGIFDAAIGTGTYGVAFEGQLNGNYGSGEWSSSIDGSSGFWEGYNYNQ